MGCKGSRVRIPPRRPNIESLLRRRSEASAEAIEASREAGATHVAPASLFQQSWGIQSRRMATVVFADLVGSTGIFERLGDETAGRFVTQLTTALSKTFEQHNGRVVKLLGDGLFVVFPAESDALAACVSIQQRLLEKPVYPGGTGNPVQMQMGVESGEVVEIDGDCYGDAVNSAARLADLAGAEQILTTQRVRDALGPLQQAQLRRLGPMYLRGKSEVTEIFRVH